MAHWTDNFTVLDTETTGFRSHDRIVEIAFVHFRDGKVADNYSALVNPQMPIPEEVSAVHGIRDADVKAAPTIQEVLPTLMTWLTDADGGPLIGHQLSFDMRMIRQSLEVDLQLTRPATCSLDYAKMRHHELRLRKKGHKVTDILEHFGIVTDQSFAHGALWDAHATGLFVPRLFEGADTDVLCPLYQYGRAKG